MCNVKKQNDFFSNRIQIRQKLKTSRPQTNDGENKEDLCHQNKYHVRNLVQKQCAKCTEDLTGKEHMHAATQTHKMYFSFSWDGHVLTHVREHTFTRTHTPGEGW
jgi:hypothetical protein